jgi:predicted kinase
MTIFKLAKQVASQYMGVYSQRRIAGPLTNAAKLRYQAVFLMGPAGSGKSFVVDGTYLKYMPGAPSAGATRDQMKTLLEQDLSEAERGLTNLKFDRAVKNMRDRGFEIELAGDKARTPFRLYQYNERGQESLIPRDQYKDLLPPDIYAEVKDLEDLVYGAPIHELPSYWRQVNPDLYKEQLQGYRAEAPGYVHEMSSEMSKAYFQAAIESGDPLVVDGTGTNLKKMQRQIKQAQDAGYRCTVLYVYVPLTISLLRNASRARKVDPNVVLQQWRAVHSNFPQLRGMADKAKLIDNTNPSYDRKLWAKNQDMINDFMMRKTGQSFVDFILDNAPREAQVLKGLGAL